MQGTSPLYEEILRLALESAYYDPRFHPVTLSELDTICIEISVLTPMQQVLSYGKWIATRCPSCGEEHISSHSYLGEAAVQVKKQIRNGLCVHCGAEIYGRYSLS